MVDARAVKAMSHPTRIRILRFLGDNDLASPNELSGELGIALGTVGYHVRRLQALGFLELVKRVPRRGAVEHFYRLRSGIEAEEAVRNIGRELLTARDGEGRAGSRAVLDAPAIADLRVSVDELFTRMRQLEAETVTRTGVASKGSSFSVDVVFMVEPDQRAARGLTS